MVKYLTALNAIVSLRTHAYDTFARNSSFLNFLGCHTNLIVVLFKYDSQRESYEFTHLNKIILTTQILHKMMPHIPGGECLHFRLQPDTSQGS